jgi:hypothetical protein
VFVRKQRQYTTRSHVYIATDVIEKERGGSSETTRRGMEMIGFQERRCLLS